MFAVVYQDEGPNGMCSQSAEITCRWFKVHLFDTDWEAQEFVKSFKDFTSRRRVKLTIASTVEGDGYHLLVDHSLQIPDIVERCIKLENRCGELEAKNKRLQRMVDNGLGEEESV